MKRTKWAFRLIILFIMSIIMGFLPWESMLSIQIKNNILNWLTSFSMGLLGLLGLLCTLAICIKLNNRFALLVKILSGCISIPIAVLLIISFGLPTFKWYDTAIYRNGNDYLVVQEQESFVSSNITYPRVIRTTSPYSIIRKIEELHELKDHDDLFKSREVNYAGKTWYKEKATQEE